MNGYPFKSREALIAEFGKMQELPYWADKDFQEVGMDRLQELSAVRAEKAAAEAEKSEVYVKPSEVAAKGIRTYSRVDMQGKGVESLTRMSDREVVARASATKNGEKFSALYNGLSVLGSEEKDEQSLMSRLAMFCNGDKEQLIRVFRSSGQFREEKPNAFYERMAEQSIQFIDRIRNETMHPKTSAVSRGKAHLGQNAKV